MAALQDSYKAGGGFPADFDNAFLLTAGGYTHYTQNFTPSSSYTLYSVKLPISKGNDLDNVLLNIFAVDVDGKPTGAAIAASSNNVDGIGTGLTVTWFEFVLASSINVVAGTEYAISLTSLQFGMNGHVNWWYTYEPGIPSGEGEIYRVAAGSGVWSGPLGIYYGLGYETYDSFSPPAGRPTTKRLIAAAASALWYEDV